LVIIGIEEEDRLGVGDEKNFDKPFFLLSLGTEEDVAFELSFPAVEDNPAEATDCQTKDKSNEGM
jgi:hypothetical protein